MSAAADALMGIFGFTRVEGEIMKTDRELLELAARAAGFVFTHDLEHEVKGKRKGPFIIRRSNWTQWNPLQDDGDALRLAVSLKLDVQFFDGYAEIHAGGDGLTSAAVETYAQDMQAATRRAIVRAAAAIGEVMK